MNPAAVRPQRSALNEAVLLHLLGLDGLTAVFRQLEIQDLVRVAGTCKGVRHGDGGLETVELPTKSPVVTVLREHAFRGVGMIPSKRPIGCSESWVAYLARCVRQRRRREAPPVAMGFQHSLRGVSAYTGVSAKATSRTSPRPSASRRFGAFG
jgi:hypothetical protein